MHTLDKFKRFLKMDGNLFVRCAWKWGSDHDPTSAYWGETPQKVYGLLTELGGSRDAKLLYVESTCINQAHPIEEPAEIVSSSSDFLHLKLKERKGYNGDMTEDFRGDEHSWLVAFDLAFHALA